MKHLFTFSLLLISSFVLKSQVVINEVIYSPSQTVELKNLGSSNVDVSSYWLCTFPAYAQVSGLTVLSGNTMLGPGELLVLSGHTYNAADDELGLYTSSGFANSNNIIDYVEWGSTGHARSTVAQMAGIWSSGDFVNDVTGTGSLEYDGSGESSSDWQVSIFTTEGAENSNVPVGCDASAIVIGNQTVCEGGSGTFQVVFTGIAPWTFTYSLNGILQDSITTSDSPYAWNVSEAGAYMLSSVTDSDCEGTAEGTAQLNIAQPPAGTLTGPSAFCSGDTAAALQVEITGLGPWEVEYQIDGVPQGTATITSSPGYIPVSTPGFYNLTGVSNVLCDGTVSGSATVSFIVVDGGDLSSTGSTDTLYSCVDDGLPSVFDFDIASTTGTNTGLVVTDEAGVILSLPTGNSIDFEGADAGTCLVWNISYEDPLTGFEVGNAIPADVDGCYSLSNAIAVVREAGADCVTSVDELTLFDGLSLYPNPVEDVLNIDLREVSSKKIRVTIFDLTGKSILSETIALGSNIFQMNVAGLESGAYLLRFQNQEGAQSTRTFIK